MSSTRAAPAEAPFPADDPFPDGARVGRGEADAAEARRLVSAGFGSPGDDLMVRRIDLNDALIRHPQASFVMRARGADMAASGIDDGDVLLVDRALTPTHGCLVIAATEGELVCRRLHLRGGASLHADPRGGASLHADPRGGASRAAGTEFQVWGVVTTVIKSVLPG